MLPYLEQNALHGLIDTAALQTTSVPLYLCPSRRGTVVARDLGGIGATVVLSDYAGATPCTCKNLVADPDCTDRYDPRDSVPLTIQQQSKTSPRSNGWSFFRGGIFGGERSNSPPDNAVYDGVITRTPWRWRYAGRAQEFPKNVPQPTRLEQISDGLSNTMVIGEKYVRSDLYEGLSWSDDRGWTDGWDPDTMRSTCFQPLGDSDSVGFSDNRLYGPATDVWYFGSAHPGILNCVFADGSVHTIRFDVDVVLFNNLGTRNDAQIVNLGQL